MRTRRHTRYWQTAGQVFRYGIATGRCGRNPAPDLHGALKPIVVKHMAAVLDPAGASALMRAIANYEGQPQGRKEWSDASLRPRLSACNGGLRARHDVGCARQVETTRDARETRMGQHWTFRHPVGRAETTQVLAVGVWIARGASARCAPMRLPCKNASVIQLDMLEAEADASRAIRLHAHVRGDARSSCAATDWLLASADTSIVANGRPMVVPISVIDEDANNPRTEFPEAELDELAEDIRQHGILQPRVIA